MMPINTRGDVAPVPTPAPNQPPENAALPAPIEPQMQNVNVPNDPRGTKRHRDEEGLEAGEPALKRARTHSDEDSQDVSEDVSDDNSEEVSEDDGIPAPLFTESDELYFAVYEGNTALVTAYLKQAPELIDAHLPVEGGLTPLCLAAKLGDLDMVRALVSAGAAINATAQDGLTPLMYASLHGNVEMIEALCRLGADPRITAPVTGSNALIYAINGKHLEACKTLIAHDADIMQMISFGTENTESFGGHTPLRFAIALDFVELIDWWLDKNKLNADFFEPSTPATLLAVAAKYGAPSVVTSLVKRGATLYAPNMYIADPRLKGVWEIASNFGQAAVIECLLNQGHRMHLIEPTIFSVWNFFGLDKVTDIYIHLGMQTAANTAADRIIDSQLRQYPEKAIEGLAQRYVMSPVTEKNLALGWWCEQGFLNAPFFNSASIKHFYASVGVLGQNTFYPERFRSDGPVTQAQQLQMVVEFLSDSICSPEWPQSFSGLNLTPNGEQIMNQIAVAQGELLLKGIARLRQRFDEQVATLPSIFLNTYLSASHQLNETDLYWRMTMDWGLYDPVARAAIRLVKEAYAKLREAKPEAITPAFAAMSLEEQLRHVIVDMLEESDKIPEIIETLIKLKNPEELDIVSELLFQQWRLFCEAFGVTKPRFSQFGPHRPAQPEPVMEVDDAPREVLGASSGEVSLHSQ